LGECVKSYQATIEYRDPRTLKPYGRNGRKHPQRQIEKLAQAIAGTGFDQPIAIDGKGTIIKGHARREAAILAGLSTVPVVVREDLSAAEVKAARIADNRIAADGEDDFEAIAAELAELEKLEFDLLLTGFEEDDIEAMLRDDGVEHEYGESQPGDNFEDDESDDEPPISSPEKYPLAIVLTSKQYALWKERKEAIGIKGDTPAFVEILGL
jgi:ParB-like nuclease domain